MSGKYQNQNHLAAHELVVEYILAFPYFLFLFFRDPSLEARAEIFKEQNPVKNCPK